MGIMTKERIIDDKTILDKFLMDFVKVIDKHCKYIVVSGFVAIAHGRSRGTEDIDMIIERMTHNIIYIPPFYFKRYFPN